MKKRAELLKLKNRMQADKTLPLRDSANNLVFGQGSVNAKIMFIGEGPGYWEDIRGLPFVGRAGALLNQLLTTINLSRNDVFITNIVHYRPPDNRDPLPEEINAFSPYLDEIIKIISPVAIVTLGRFSMAKFIPNARISSVHGKAFKVNFLDMSIIVIPMYHPAAALRNPTIKKDVFEDFAKIPVLVETVEDIIGVEVKKETAANFKTDKNNLRQMSLI
jgi:uracil-DNA glycosylase